MSFVGLQFQVYIIPTFYLFYKLNEINLLNFYGYFETLNGLMMLLCILLIITYLSIYDYFTYFKKEKSEYLYEKYKGKFENLIKSWLFTVFLFYVILPLLLIGFIDLIFRMIY